MQPCRAATVIERIRGQGERVHIPLGGVCNNHCLFCMEDDRESRARAAERMTAERVRWVMEQHRGAQELCFTSGEPTTRADLPQFIRWARELGYERVSLMTNGRRLSYGPYAQALVRAGLNRVYVSIHGDSRSLHEGLTRTPGSFDQTMQGIRNVARLKPRGLELNSSTVLTRRNVDRQAEIYAVLRALGVDQVVFNALQLNGGALQHFDQVVPTYRQTRAGFERVLETAGDHGEAAFLVDVPMCVTEGLPDNNRGYVERHLHYETDRASEANGDAADPLRAVHTTELDSAFRGYGEPCEGCIRRGACPGVYTSYVQRFGWGEFVGVRG
ncbi:MAG: radical SAM protein [Deltaproteobacteria bacterium]|nr:radical SAM protein [Deltaproteobacteria bacterium]